MPRVLQLDHLTVNQLVLLLSMRRGANDQDHFAGTLDGDLRVLQTRGLIGPYRNRLRRDWTLTIEGDRLVDKLIEATIV